MAKNWTVKKVTGYKYRCALCGNEWDGRKLEAKVVGYGETGKVESPGFCTRCKRADWRGRIKK